MYIWYLQLFTTINGENSQQAKGPSNSSKQHLQKTGQQQVDRFDMHSVSNACNLIRHLICVDNFRVKILNVPPQEKDTERIWSSRLDHLLRFAYFIFSSVDSSVEEDFDVTSGSYSKRKKSLVSSAMRRF